MGDWAKIQLGNFVKGVRGVSYSPSDLKDGKNSNTYFLLRSNNIQSNVLDLGEVQIVDKKCVKEGQVLKKGDIIVCMSNGSKRLVGKNCIFNLDEQGFCVGAFCSSFSPNGIADEDFVFQLFQSDQYQRFIDVSLAGSAINNLKNSIIEEFEFFVPKSKQEQSTIATILTTIDQAIEKTEQLIAKYERIKTGLMQDLLTRGLDEQGNIRSEETHEFKDSPLGRIPKEWEVVSFASVSDVIDSLHKTPSYSDNGYSMVRGTEIYDGFLEDSILENAPKVSPNVYSEFTEKYSPQRGDILMTRVGSYGVTCLIETKTPFCLGQNTVVINAKSVDSVFLYYVTKAEYISRQVELNLAGSSQKTLSLGHIRKLKLGLPKEKGEQKRISETIFNTDNSIVTHKNQLRKLKKNKTGLMQDLLTGKVRVDALMNNHLS